MAKKTGINLIDEEEAKKAKPGKYAGKCPVCGAPGGKYRCAECGWGVTELGPDFSTSLKDPVSTIIHAKFSYGEIKKENAELREKVEKLLENNRKLSELAESLEGEIEEMKARKSEKFVYSYGKGGWKESIGLEDSKLHLRKSDVNIEDINDQLKEIMKLLERHGKNNLNKCDEK